MGTLVQDAQQHILVDKYSISNPICHLLALLGAHHILHVSRIRVNHLFLHCTQIYKSARVWFCSVGRLVTLLWGDRIGPIFK
jgi:hypothetical protein